MQFYYELKCSPLAGGKKAVKLNGGLLYFAAINTLLEKEKNTWEKAKTLTNKYIKDISSVKNNQQVAEVTRLLTFIAMNKEFGVDRTIIWNQKNKNNIYFTYKTGTAAFHIFRICKLSGKENEDKRLQKARNELSKLKVMCCGDNISFYVSTYDVKNKSLTIIDPPIETNVCDIDPRDKEKNYIEKLYQDFEQFGGENGKAIISYEGEQFRVVDLPELGIKVGLDVNCMTETGRRTEVYTDQLIIKNGIYIEQYKDVETNQG